MAAFKLIFKQGDPKVSIEMSIYHILCFNIPHSTYKFLGCLKKELCNGSDTIEIGEEVWELLCEKIKARRCILILSYISSIQVSNLWMPDQAPTLQRNRDLFLKWLSKEPGMTCKNRHLHIKHLCLVKSNLPGDL